MFSFAHCGQRMCRHSVGDYLHMNVFELSRKWFDWCFDHPDEIKPNHTALYFFCIEHCNRLGWKEKFGLPTEMAKSAIGIHSYNTYSQTLNDLIEWGFIKMITKSKNQYSSNIIALSNFNKATSKALDKALIQHHTKHHTKQSDSTIQSTGESIDSIDIQVNKETKKHIFKPPFLSEVVSYFKENGYAEIAAEKAFKYYNDAGWIDSKGNKVKNWKQKMQGVWFKDENKQQEEKPKRMIAR